MSSLETSPQKGEIGAALAQFAGSLDHISAREITQAIEQERDLTNHPPPVSNNKGRSTMSMEQAILEAVRSLPLDKQQEILVHATRLRNEARPKQPFQSVKGILAGRSSSISAEYIDQTRREMWKNFPREDV